MSTRSRLIGLALGTLLLGNLAHAATDPADACKDTKAKTAGKKAADVLKAYGKNLKKPDPIKLSASISKAQSKLTKGFGKAESKGGCLTTGDVGAIEAKVDAFANDAIAEINPPAQTCGNDVQEGTEGCDGADATACPGLCQANCICPAPICGNGILEAGEECESPCDVGGPCGGGELCGVDCTCVAAAPCNCGAVSQVSYETSFGPGFCGELRDAGNTLLLDLECGQSYVGGGQLGAAPPITPIPIGKTFYNVECCYGDTLALTATTSGDTGSNKTCSSQDCTLGAPIPTLVHPVPQSVCTQDDFAVDAGGSLDCTTGEVHIHQPIIAPVFLTGDLLPKRCSAASTNQGEGCVDDSECIGGTCDDDAGQFLCSGGTNDGNPCANEDSNCPGGTCEGVNIQPCAICNPTTNVCNGGPNQGLPCTPGTAAFGAEYPTSLDCPVDSLLELPASEQPFELTTGVASKTAADGQFCGWCRDVNGEQSNCFEGDKRVPTCPASSIQDCGTGTGGTECGQGFDVACNSDADCFPPYETCAQRHAGASDEPTATSYTQTGAPAGDLTDGLGHAATLVSVHCVPPTDNQVTDASADFPGPGSTSLPVTFQLLP